MKMRFCIAGLLLFVLSVSVRPAAAQDKMLAPADIDKMMRVEWKKAKVVPAPPVDDARFLRRIYLDITGTIPPPDAVKAFLAEKSPNKRGEAIEELLNSPGYVRHWVNYWDEALMGRQLRPQQGVDRFAFRRWLAEKFEKNTPYHKFVYELLTATGQNSAGGPLARGLGANAPAAMMMQEGEEEATAAEGRVNGAVNWFMKYAQTPADLSGNASKIFLGVQIQCAQCHDHKTEKWTQEDFRRFTACFNQTRPVPVDATRQMPGMRRFEVRDVNRPMLRGRPQGRGEFANAVPTALDGTDFSSSPNRRQALAAWITAPENPYFADAIVNRLWAYFMGRGFVDPIDDFRPTNPATMPALMKRISQDFVANEYDLKHLLRLICNSQVYQLSSAPSQNDKENEYWSRARLKAMGPEQLLDSLITATNLSPVLERLAGNNAEQMKAQITRQLTFLFDVDEEFEQKDFEGTIPQALLLLNGSLVNNGASPIPGTALAEVLAMEGDDSKKIEALYLRTVSRKPTPTETKKWLAFVSAPREVVVTDAPAPPPDRRPGRGLGGQVRRIGGGPDPFARLAGRGGMAQPTAKQQAYEDLFWALLNSSEFLFNH